MSIETKTSGGKSNKVVAVVAILLVVGALVLGGMFFYLRGQEEKYFTEAQAAYEAGNFHEAIDLFNQAMAVQPAFVRQYDQAALSGRALAHLYDENYQAAIDDATAVLAHNPTEINLLFARAQAYEGIHDFENAVADLTIGLEEDPQNPELLTQRATLYAVLGDDALAEADYEALLAIDPNQSWPRLQRLARLARDGQTEAVVTEAEAIIAIDDTLAEPFKQRGWVLLQSRNDLAAMADFERAHELNNNDAEALLGQALIHQLNERAAVALDLSATILQQDDDPLAQAIHGAVLVSLNDPVIGMDELNNAVARVPEATLPMALYLRGLAHLELGQTAAALSDAEQIVAHSPEWSWGHVLLATAHSARDERPQAQLAIQQALDLAPDLGTAYTTRAALYLADGETPAARADLEKALSLMPEYLPALLLRAQAATMDEAYDQALADLETAVTLHPEHTAVYAERAFVHAQLENWEAARADYDRVLIEDATMYEALVGRAQANMALADYETAIIDLSAAIVQDPQNATLITQRAQSHLALNNLTEAQRDAERANNLDDDLPLPYLVFGMTQLEEENYFQAVVELSEAIDLDPGLAAAFAARGRAYFLLDDPDRARADAARAIELNPELAEGYLVRALVASYDLNWRDALADMDEALSHQPEDLLLLENRGLIYLDSGDANSALDDFNQMLAIDADSIDARMFKAAALDQLGRYDDALVALQSALDLAATADVDALIIEDVELAESTMADLNRIPPDIDGTRTWTDAYQGFTVSYPADWRQYVEPGADAPLFLVGPLDKDYRANLSLFFLEYDFVPSARDIARYSNPDANLYDDFEMLSDQSIRVGGRSAVRRVFTWRASDQRLRDVFFHIIQTYVVDGQRVLVFTSFARSEDFEKYEPIFDGIMNSFKFE